MEALAALRMPNADITEEHPLLSAPFCGSPRAASREISRVILASTDSQQFSSRCFGEEVPHRNLSGYFLHLSCACRELLTLTWGPSNRAHLKGGNGKGGIRI